MTSNKEDYLKILYEKGGVENPVSNKVIAGNLDVAAASVSEMLGKLEKEGLVRYQPYKGATLTESGLATVIDLVRSHRLWEVFLIRHLGYSWREAHEEAHLLEHATPKRMVDRLDTFLEYPQSCPHGFIIPRESERKIELDLVCLSHLLPGDLAILRKIAEDVALLDYLENRGLKIDEKIEILKVDDYEGPTIFRQGNQEITISHKATQQIYVELIQK